MIIKVTKHQKKEMPTLKPKKRISQSRLRSLKRSWKRRRGDSSSKMEISLSLRIEVGLHKFLRRFSVQQIKAPWNLIQFIS